MRQSKLFTKAFKEAPKDEKSVNARLLVRAGFVDKLTAGVYTLLPLGLLVYKNIEKIIREEMNAIGGQEILMPALIPKEKWEQTDRWKMLDVLFKLKGVNEKEYGLGATHEEVISPLAQKFVSSYRDLPFYVYQFQTKFRDELRTKSGLLRGREFEMKDLYSFHKNQEDLDRYYKIAKKAYFEIFKRVGVGDKTYLTFASGGSFSKYSHEFQTITENGEDEIYVCKDCKIAVNREIIEELKNKCPECKNENLEIKKSIEIGNIFKLGKKYSEPFNLVFKDEKGEEKSVLMGCYGIGLTRLMGAIVEVNHDNKGIIWPEEVSPFSVHLIALKSKDEKITSKIKEETEKIYSSLQKKGKDVLYDDREDKSAGEKFAESDLIGVSERVIVSERTLAEDFAEIKLRKEEKGKLVKIKNITKT